MGYVAALQIDPIEKKPFFHILPGSDALTFGMLGCDFHCSYCQNSFTSQAMRDPASDAAIGVVRRTSPEQIVEIAQRRGASVIASSYNEPLITSEWAVSIFRLALQAGMKCVYISNGNATSEALAYLRPYLVGYKIDFENDARPAVPPTGRSARPCPGEHPYGARAWIMGRSRDSDRTWL